MGISWVRGLTIADRVWNGGTVPCWLGIKNRLALARLDLNEHGGMLQNWRFDMDRESDDTIVRAYTYHILSYFLFSSIFAQTQNDPIAL